MEAVFARAEVCACLCGVCVWRVALCTPGSDHLIPHCERRATDAVAAPARGFLGH